MIKFNTPKAYKPVPKIDWVTALKAASYEDGPIMVGLDEKYHPIDTITGRKIGNATAVSVNIQAGGFSEITLTVALEPHELYAK